MSDGRAIHRPAASRPTAGPRSAAARRQPRISAALAAVRHSSTHASSPRTGPPPEHQGPGAYSGLAPDRPRPAPRVRRCAALTPFVPDPRQAARQREVAETAALVETQSAKRHARRQCPARRHAEPVTGDGADASAAARCARDRCSSLHQFAVVCDTAVALREIRSADLVSPAHRLLDRRSRRVGVGP
jgi:hypothetical protein